MSKVFEFSFRNQIHVAGLCRRLPCSWVKDVQSANLAFSKEKMMEETEALQSPHLPPLLVNLEGLELRSELRQSFRDRGLNHSSRLSRTVGEVSFICCPLGHNLKGVMVMKLWIICRL